MVNLQIKIPKLNKILEPSISELKEFGAQFSKKEWELLTNNKNFINKLMDDLVVAEKLSKKILDNNK